MAFSDVLGMAVDVGVSIFNGLVLWRVSWWARRVLHVGARLDRLLTATAYLVDATKWLNRGEEETAGRSIAKAELELREAVKINEAWR